MRFFKIALLTTIFFLAMQVTNAQSKNGFLKRAYINTVARYNYFYNAQLRVNTAQMNTALAHKNNFDEIIHLFPFSTQDELKANVPVMDEAIKKCTHILTRRQTSKWIDDSYLLLGRANFFKGDFYSAQDAFDYITATFKDKPIRFEAEIWNIKALQMLGKYDESVALSSIILNDPALPEKFQKDLHLLQAEGLIFQEKYELAYISLKKALPNLNKLDYKYRVYFVAGQLCLLTNRLAEAVVQFDKVSKSNPTYDFDFFARINKVRVLSAPEIKDYKKAKSVLQKMLKDDKNLDLKDQIYFELAMINLKEGDKLAASNNFSNALKTPGKTKDLKSKIYLTYAELLFEQNDYRNSQLYYDSAVQSLSSSHPQYENISQRHQVLTSLIKDLVNIHYQDSMLRLAESADFRKKVLENIKAEELRKQEEEENRKNDPFSTPPAFQDFSQNTLPNTADSRFPFYNAMNKTKGLGDFERNWGKRENGDFWRIAAIAQSEEKQEQQKTTEEEENEELTIVDELPKDILEQDAKYFANVPFSKLAKDEAQNSLSESYFNASLLYRDKLNETLKSLELLLEFIRRNNGNGYRENALYLLVKIYRDLGQNIQAEEHLSKLKLNYPESKFIPILEGNVKLAEEGLQSIDLAINTLYEKTYNAYKNKNPNEVVTLIKKSKKDYPGNELDGQFDFLYALVLADSGKLEPYNAIMQKLAANYSGTDLGKLAQERVDAYQRFLNPEKAEQESLKSGNNSVYIAKDEKEMHHFILQVEKQMDFNLVKIAFSDFNREYRPDMGLQVTGSFLQTGQRIVMVTGFQNSKETLEYIKEIQINQQLLSAIKLEADKNKFICISKSNFNILMKEKKWEDYLRFYIKNYL